MNRPIVSAIALALITTTATPAAAAPARSAERTADDATLQGYVLSMDKVTRYANAVAAAGRDAKRNPALRADEARMRAEPEHTLADMRNRIKRHPMIAAYFHRAGLSDDDAVMLGPVLMMATMAASLPVQRRGARGAMASPQQISFVKQHQKEIAPIFAQMQSSEE